MIGAVLDTWLSGRRGWSLLGLLALILVVLPLVVGDGGQYTLLLIMTVFIFATLGHAWNLLAGFCGLLSFGIQVYVGLSGFTVAILSYYAGVPVWLALPLGGLGAAAFGWLLAIPVSETFVGKKIWAAIAIAVAAWIIYEILIAFDPNWDVFGGAYIRRVIILLLIFLGALPLLRLQGAYFAVATWLIAAAVASVFNEWKFVGAGGGMNIVSDTSIAERYYAALIVVALSTAAVWWLLRSRYGLALTAVRDEEEAAAAIGIDIRRVKTLVFVISAPMAGLAAGLFYIDNVTITPPDAFHIRWSAFTVFIVVAGGMGTLAGPLIGAVIFVLVDRLLAGYLGGGELAIGVFAVLIILLLPRGVMGLINDLRASGREVRRRGRMPSLLASAVKHRNAEQGGDGGEPKGPPGVVSAFLVPGNPLPYLVQHNPPWQPIVEGYSEARKILEQSRPDVILLYSTQWLAVLDQLWQTRRRLIGVHVDENWYEFGDLPFDIVTDTELAESLVEGSRAMGVTAKGVDYEGFPIDTGAIVANGLLNPEGRYPLVQAANNVYHDFDMTMRLGAMAAKRAVQMGRRVAIVGVGGLSGSVIREEIDIAEDRIADPTDESWNQRMLELIAAGDSQSIQAQCAAFAKEAKADMGFKHMAWLLGAMDGRWRGANILGYGPAYGSGAAVVSFDLET